MKRPSFVWIAALFVSLLASSARATTRILDTIIHDGISTWVTTSNVITIDDVTDIETYAGFDEFVASGTFGLRDYYVNNGGWTYAPMVGATDYIRIANGYGAVGNFYGLSDSGRVDKIDNNTATLTTGIVTGLTNPRAIEAYSPFNDEFFVISDEGVRDYYFSGGNFNNFFQVSALTDYIDVANNGQTSGKFFALGADGRVDQFENDGNNAYTTTNILPAGTLTNPKYIESYDGNNEFVTVSAEGVREYYFTGTWQPDQMSTSPNYIAVVDNPVHGANYWALRAPLEGDYNGDGTVDSADYVVWRKDPTNPAYGGDPDGYDTWRANFGNPSGSGSALGSSAANVPEPGTIAIALVAGLGLMFSRRTMLIYGQLNS